MCSGGQEYDSLFFINLVEETPRADTVTPGLRRDAFEFFDVWPELGLLSELWIDDTSKLLKDSCLS